MTYYAPGCPGYYDFDDIARFARKRFIEGYDTIDLMTNASTYREKEEIALVAMLDLDDETVADLKLDCRHADECKVTHCQSLLRKIINEDLALAAT